MFSRFEQHKAINDEERAYNARMKPVWDAEAASIKSKKNREDMISLAKATGTPVSCSKPKDFLELNLILLLLILLLFSFRSHPTFKSHLYFTQCL